MRCRPASLIAPFGYNYTGPTGRLTGSPNANPLPPPVWVSASSRPSTTSTPSVDSVLDLLVRFADNTNRSPRRATRPKRRSHSLETTCPRSMSRSVTVARGISPMDRRAWRISLVEEVPNRTPAGV